MDPDAQLCLDMEYPGGANALIPAKARRVRRSSSAPRILRMRDIVKLTGVHRSTIYRWIDRGCFPEKDAPRQRPTGWLSTTYERWLFARGLRSHPGKID